MSSNLLNPPRTSHRNLDVASRWQLVDAERYRRAALTDASDVGSVTPSDTRRIIGRRSGVAESDSLMEMDRDYMPKPLGKGREDCYIRPLPPSWDIDRWRYMALPCRREHLAYDPEGRGGGREESIQKDQMMILQSVSCLNDFNNLHFFLLRGLRREGG